eukprot:168943_1
MDYDEEVNECEIEELDDGDKLIKYKQDAEEWLKNKAQVHCARSIYKYILDREKWADNECIWWDAAQFIERKHGTMQSTQQVLSRAVECCPQSINLWLFAILSLNLASTLGIRTLI